MTDSARAEIEVRKRADARSALYVNDDELRRRLNPHMGRDRFLIAVRAAELAPSPNGKIFPRVSALFDGRYWPGVVEYLDDFEKAHDHEAATAAPEPPIEHPHARFRRKARPQVHPPDGPALLVRQAGGEEPDGISGSVHRLAARR
jgi:hypothetical protein